MIPEATITSDACVEQLRPVVKLAAADGVWVNFDLLIDIVYINPAMNRSSK